MLMNLMLLLLKVVLFCFKLLNKKIIGIVNEIGPHLNYRMNHLS